MNFKRCRKALPYVVLFYLLLADATLVVCEDSEYLVGSQDVITVKVLKEAEFSGDFKIDSKGNLNYPVVGDIPVLGKNLEEIKKILVEILSKDYIISPKVSVSIKEYNSKKVMVLGNVARPGVYSLKERTMILDIITQAGGISSAGSSRVFVLRKEELKTQEAGQERPQDKKESIWAESARKEPPAVEVLQGSKEDAVSPKSLQKGEEAKTEEEQDTDVVTTKDSVSSGEDLSFFTAAPKIEPESERVLDQTMAQNGGSNALKEDPVSIEVSESPQELKLPAEEAKKEETAKENIAGKTQPLEKNIKEISSGEPVGKNLNEDRPLENASFFSSPKMGAKLKPMIVNYDDILKKGDLSQNVEILGGDIINVPKANEIFVFGSVKNPGPVTYAENMGILQAVSLAGGTAPEASPGSTYVLRMESGKEKKIKVNFNKVLKQKAKNLELQPNDVIVIPESFF